jgi:hypothetical protein
MLELLGVAWTAWKVSAKRFGPAGGVLVAIVAVVGFVLLRGWLADRYPKMAEALEEVV